MTAMTRRTCLALSALAPIAVGALARPRHTGRAQTIRQGVRRRAGMDVPDRQARRHGATPPEARLRVGEPDQGREEGEPYRDAAVRQRAVAALVRLSGVVQAGVDRGVDVLARRPEGATGELSRAGDVMLVEDYRRPRTVRITAACSRTQG